MTKMSQLQRQLLSGGGGVTLFTQQEFDEALALAKAEIMAVAIQTTKQAILIEREECAKIAEEWSDGVTDPESKAKEVAELIRNRIPSQRN